MLASLFRGGNSAGQRTSQYIESATDDAHTRGLLFGHTQNILNLPTSPPPSPFGSSSIRPSSYDDQGGLDLEEKDVRVLLAQDAHGDIEKPILLFDSKRPVDTASPSGKSQPASRSPIPVNWQADPSSAAKADNVSRTRSSTFSGSQSSWSKAARSARPQDDPFLHCMFGAKYFRKTETSTKLHIIPARVRQKPAADQQLQNAPNLDHRRRTPLQRAHTSGQQTPNITNLDLDNKDCLLITRLFQVTLDENAKIVVKPSSSRTSTADKPIKLVENRVPQYAVGFVLQLPTFAHRPRSSSSRALRDAGFSQSLTSANSSYGSDMHSSWTFLDAIPASLSSSITLNEEDDRRLDSVVENWDVILRAMACFERTAIDILETQLQKNLSQAYEPQTKLPKEKFMQRTNQRMVAIHDASQIARCPLLSSAASDVSRRIAYAVRIPRVITGLGITTSHWTDEARMLYRSCGGKQQGFFLFNLFTAFLGNNIQWLERIAPEWYRTQFHTFPKKAEELTALASRTIIVSEHKGLARRLVYVLSSFLPGQEGIDGLRQRADEARLGMSFSPTGHLSRQPSVRRPSKPTIGLRDAVDLGPEVLSTSASSQGSYASTLATKSPRKHFSRKFSNTIQIRNNKIEGDGKTGAGTTSSIMPQALQTPTAYIAGTRDSYFVESAIVETNDSIATAGLAKVLHKAESSHRRTSSVSSRFGSLVSGISEIWSNKQGSTGDRGSTSSVSHDASPIGHKRTSSSAISVGRNNALQSMVDELDQTRVLPKQPGNAIQTSSTLESRPMRTPVALPRMHVDETDGVVDVELDLPGFSSWSSPRPTFTTSPRVSRQSVPEGEGSICSLRSLAVQADNTCKIPRVNVAGYLRRHHEDFALQAVRPYSDLIADVKRTMRSEITPRETIEQMLQGTASTTWAPVCTTLIADTKSFTVRRLALRRQYEVKRPVSSGDRATITASSAMPGSNLVLINEQITDDIIMEFDTTLANAIEKILDVGVSTTPRSNTSSRVHSRNVSLGTASNVEQLDKSDSSGRAGKAKTEQRDLVISALEDVVKSVNANLNNPETEMHGEDNVLREGVKQWMLNVEQTSVW